MSPQFHAQVIVMPKPEVADPQGQAIEGALERLGSKVGAGDVRARHVRAGKMFHLDVDAPDLGAAELALRALADKVLANPNTEYFECSVQSPSQ